MKSQVMKRTSVAILFATLALPLWLSAKEKRVLNQRNDSIFVMNGSEKIKAPRILAPVGKIELVLDIGTTEVIASWDTAMGGADIWLIDLVINPTYPDEDVVDKRINSRTGREIFSGLKPGKEYGIWSVLVGPKPFYLRGESWGTTFVTADKSDNPSAVIQAVDLRADFLDKFELIQNYPNPFNPETQIEFRVAKTEFVKLSVYDLLGRERTVLVNGQRIPGTYKATWNAGGMPSGIYFAVLEAGGDRQIRRMILTK